MKRFLIGWLLLGSIITLGLIAQLAHSAEQDISFTVKISSINVQEFKDAIDNYCLRSAQPKPINYKSWYKQRVLDDVDSIINDYRDWQTRQNKSKVKGVAE